MKSILIEKPLRKTTMECMTIPDRLEYLRCMLGYPVNIFEKTLGMNKGSYKNYILTGNGKYFRVDTVDKVEAVFGASKNWVLTGTGSGPYGKKGYEEYIYSKNLMSDPNSKKREENMGIGSRVKIVREDSGLSGAVFASRIGLTSDALYRVEKGENALSIFSVNKLVKEFDILDPWLLRGEGRKRGA